MENLRVAVVGLGVMGEAIIQMLINSDIPLTDISVLEKRSHRLQEIKEKYGLSADGITESKIVFLAFKPQDMTAGLQNLKIDLQPGTLIVSIMAGINCSQIQDTLGHSVRIIRVMPNTPLLVREGMSVIAQGESATKDDISWVEKVFSKFGKTLILTEELMDAVTAVSGSGPAYLFELSHCMIESAITLGLSRKDATTLVKQTMIGASKMLSISDKDVSTLKQEVTSPNGTTFAALDVFARNNLERIVLDAMSAARNRSKELSKG